MVVHRKDSLIQKGLLLNVAEETKSDEGRLFAIGDIHGCSTALRTLIEAIDPRPEDTLVILGDFIDCGPDSKGVVEQLIALSNRCRLITLLGNHEEMLLNAVDSKSEYRYWLKLGGKETLRSYSALFNRPGRDPGRPHPIHPWLPQLLRDGDPHLRPCQL